MVDSDARTARVELRLVRVFCIFAALLLSACTPLATKDFPRKTAEQQLQLVRWQAKGKLGISQHGKAQSVFFDWRNNNYGYTIRLSGALGIGSSKLVRHKDTVTLVTKKERIIKESAEDLLQQTMGWSMPVSNLRYWVKGLSAPYIDIEQQQLGEHGELLQLHQQGWQIRYANYSLIKGYYLPGKIIARRDSLKITMVIKDWDV